MLCYHLDQITAIAPTAFYPYRSACSSVFNAACVRPTDERHSVATHLWFSVDYRTFHPTNNGPVRDDDAFFFDKRSTHSKFSINEYLYLHKNEDKWQLRDVETGGASHFFGLLQKEDKKTGFPGF